MVVRSSELSDWSSLHLLADRKPPGVGRGRGRGREEVTGGRGSKGRGQEDIGGRGGRGRGGVAGRGRGLSALFLSLAF